MTVTRILERKDKVLDVVVDPRRAIREAAEDLSLQNIARARAELANEALARLTSLLWEIDSLGQLVNVDPVDGRIAVPLPWGKSGYRKWGLTSLDGNVLRTLLQVAQKNGAKVPPLFVWNPDSRSWYLNLFDYRSREAAEEYLRRNQISPEVWRKAHKRFTTSPSGSPKTRKGADGVRKEGRKSWGND